MSISISSRKAKARRLQQWVCQQISDITNIRWGKDELIASREMGQSGVDVRLIGKAKKLFPFSIECKAQEKWDIHSFIRHAKANWEGGTDWLLFLKRSREKTVVCFSELAAHRYKINLHQGCLSYNKDVWYINKWIKDVRDNCYWKEPDVWMVMAKKKNGSWRIFMDAERFFSIMKYKLGRKRS